VRREVHDFDKHIKHFTSYKYTVFYRLGKEDFAIFIILLAPRLHRTHSRPHGCAAAVDPRVMVTVTLRSLVGVKILDLGWPYGLCDLRVYVKRVGYGIGV
jgi:hypothetical protein